MVGLLSLESCFGRPKMRNSILEGFRDRKLDDINSTSALNLTFNHRIFGIPPGTWNARGPSILAVPQRPAFNFLFLFGIKRWHLIAS